MKQEWKHYLDNSFERKNKKSCRPCIIIICRETLNVWSCKMLKKVKKENHKTGKVHIYKLKKEQQQYSTHKAHDRNKLDQVKIMRQYMSNLFGNCIITHYFVYFLSLSLQLLEYIWTTLRKPNLHFLSNSKRLIYFKQVRR